MTVRANTKGKGAHLLVPVIQANDECALVDGIREMGMSTHPRNNWFKTRIGMVCQLKVYRDPEDAGEKTYLR